jgi:toxin-antitoxin system PIN domain toxin
VKLLDVNVLIYAHRADALGHREHRQWLDDLLQGNEPFGVSDLVLSGFLRIVTHTRVFDPPTPLPTGLAFVESLRSHPQCLTVMPSERHWAIFVDLCRKVQARGNLVPDAYFAALAIDAGCEWVSTDRDYARFPGLRWRHPFGD